MKFLCFSLLIILGLASCKFRVDKSGYMFENIDTNFIQKNITSKNTLIKNMGSPSVISWIDEDEYWIYYSEEIKHILFMKPKIIDRNILVLAFNYDDRVKYVQKLDLSDQNNKFFHNISKTYIKTHQTNIFKDFFSNVGTVKP